jgi:LacI family transcriptional regulator
VSDGLSERVHRAATNLGYRANVSARGLRLSRTMTMGVVFERMDAPVYLDILTGLTAAADEIGYSILVANADADPDRQRHFVRQMYERRVDALLLSGLRGTVRGELEPFSRAGIPTLGLFGRDRDARDIPVAISPQEKQLTTILARLKELGHRKVMYLGGVGALATRWKILQNAAADVGGLALEQCLMPFETPLPELRDRYAQVFESHRDATALFVHSWNIAAMNAALRVRGETIPDDWSVVTFTDSRYTAALNDPPLSALWIDSVEFGRQTLAIIEDWLAGTPPPSVNLLDLAVWHETESIGSARPR